VKIKHKGLRRFMAHGGARGVDAAMAPKLTRILSMLAQSSRPDQMDNPGWKLHPLKGKRAGYWSVWVTGNWRVTFRFEGNEAVDVDLVDYH